MKLSEAVELFIDRPEIRAATRKTYKQDLSHMAGFLGAERRLEDIIPTDLMRYGNHLNKEEAIKSSFTFNKHVKTIRTFFNWCVKAQIITASPAAILKRKRVNEAVPKSKAMPDNKLFRLIEYVAATPRGWHPREEALVRFLADTGCRISGAASLTEEMIDLRERSAKLFEKGKVEPHVVHFGRECAHAISAWLLQRKADKGRYVFSEDGHRMTNDSLGQYFTRICLRAGIGQYGPHSLRHRLAHKAIERFPVSIVAKMLGDSVEIVMKHYLPQDDATVEKAMREMTTDHILSVSKDELLNLNKRST